MPPYLLVAIVVVLIAVVIYLVTRKAKSAEGFFTDFAQEEPTRSYTPYTGTIAYGTWGTKPWAEEFPRGCADSGKCQYTNLRDVQVGTDIQPICGTCASSLPTII